MWRPEKLMLLVTIIPVAIACQDSAPGTVTDAGQTTPGDPAIYAPDGWPLRIGDRVTWGQRNTLFDHFPNWSGIFAMRLVDGEVYSARFRDVPDARGVYVYEGHFQQLASPIMAQSEESPHPANPSGPPMLPVRFHGKIRYRVPTHVEAELIESALTGRSMRDLFPCWSSHGCDEAITGQPVTELPCWTLNRCEPVPMTELHAYNEWWRACTFPCGSVCDR